MRETRLKMLNLRCPWNTLTESSGVFSRIEGMEFGSNFLEVRAKIMGMNEISSESIEGRGSGPVVQN